ncbi:metal ABC transporter substrate-binding protein [Candidatus Pantoea deserta]|uniref:Lipoprotein n=1 Tax=Candidatus Pantoea deserta TaxID=1869313 RepID=A0A3N4NFI5_9GAMM|nr:MetQ/NlpA family lipoprotein [Pantoea deserta]RPD93067.1 metal ABC transporter substrate-binding protein [Pantoea deserta]
MFKSKIKSAHVLALSLSLVTGLVHATTLKVGVRAGVDEELWNVAAVEAKKSGLDVDVVVISGSADPNEALNNGDLNADSFQHIPYLKSEIQNRGYKITNVADTYISPIGFYSNKFKKLEDLPNNATVSLPSDPPNQTRALVILRDHKLITLKDGFDPYNGTATLNDVVSNPKKLKFIEAGNIIQARSLNDVDAAAIENQFAAQVNLYATRDGIAIEKRENNPYVNVIAVKESDKNAEWLPALIKAYQSEPVKQYIKTHFHGSVIPAF